MFSSLILGDFKMPAVAIDIPNDLTCKEEYEVRDEHVAQHIGNGDVRVLSTPSMILFMERTALKCVQSYLPVDYTTVGTYVEVHHLNPAPVGSIVRVEARLVNREGRKLLFEVKAYHGETLIGEGKHERFIVNRERFLEKIKGIMQRKV